MKNQTFGIEIEMTGITRWDAANVVANHFGSIVDYRGGGYDLRIVRDEQGREWKVMRDASVDAPEDKKCEFVSPICRWEDIELVQALVRKLRKAGGRPHTSCGIHVHIGRGQHTPATLRTLMNMMSAKEDLIALALQIDGRRLNRWCQKVDQGTLRNVNAKRPTTDDDFAKVWYGTESDRVVNRCKNTHYHDSRYHMLNLHSVFQKGTVEFRMFNSTMHAGEVKSYIQFAMAISNAALVAKTASPKKPVTDNPKYALRCWLLKLGFIGDEFKTARLHLTAALEGNSAWRHGA